MRKILLLTMATLAVTATAAVAQAPATTPATTRIGYINSQRLIAEAPGAAEARTTLQREMEKHQADLALADDSIKTMFADFQKKQLAMSKDARDKEEASIRTRQQALQQRATSLEEQMQKRQQDLVKPIMDRINTVLGDMRKDGGYVVILDVASGGIVAADPAADLTEVVLAKLKAASPTAAAKKP